jgi:hypothetical protein
LLFRKFVFFPIKHLTLLIKKYKFSEGNFIKISLTVFFALIFVANAPLDLA